MGLHYDDKVVELFRHNITLISTMQSCHTLFNKLEEYSPIIYADGYKLAEIERKATKRMTKYHTSRNLDNMKKSAAILKDLFTLRDDQQALKTYNSVMDSINEFEEEIDTIKQLYHALMIMGNEYISKYGIFIEEDIMCIRNANFNPYVTVVFNGIDKRFEDFLCKSRSLGITVVIMIQSTTIIPRNILSTINNFIFTTTEDTIESIITKSL